MFINILRLEMLPRIDPDFKDFKMLALSNKFTGIKGGNDYSSKSQEKYPLYCVLCEI